MEDLLNYILIALSGSLSAGALVAVARHCHGLLMIFKSCARCFCIQTHTSSHLDTLPVYFARSETQGSVSERVVLPQQQLAPIVSKAHNPNLPSTAVCEV